MGFSLITVITDLIVIPTVSNLLNEYLGYGYKRKLLLEMPIPSSFKSGTGWVFTVTVILWIYNSNRKNTHGSRITFLLLAVTKIRNPGTRYSPKKFPSRSMIHLQIQAYESSTVDWFIGLVVDHYGSGEFPWVNTPSLTPYPIIHKES